MAGVVLALGLGVLALPKPASAEFLTDSWLTQSSPIGAYRADCFYGVHNVKLTAGTIYTIDLRSGEFDAYLFLVDPFGNIVGMDDDSGGGLDARIVYRPSVTGTYRIVATTFRPFSTGRYRVHVTP
jgi:hypothetical protein